ncbi:MAG: hypothetical protein ACTHKG_10180 [Nocardioides sp.]
MSTGAHYAGAGWMERQRLHSRWKRDHYRVLSAQQPLDAIAAQLDAFDPAILTGYPSVVELLAEEQRAGRLRISPVVVELAGESLSEAGRARIAARLGGALHEVYSASEFMILGFDCAEGRLHVNSDWALLEPVDEHYRPTPPGEASYTVLLTNLANAVQPLIRYDLGDSVVAEPSACRCGNPLPAIRVQGRCDDVLRFTDPSGRVVALPPLALGSVADQTPGVRRSQLLMTSPTTLRIRLDTEPGADPEQVWAGVRAATAGYLAAQGLAGVELVRAPEPPEPARPGGKYRQVIAGTAR